MLEMDGIIFALYVLQSLAKDVGYVMLQQVP